MGPYLDPRRAGKSALMGPLEGPIGALTGPPQVSIEAPLGALSRAPIVPAKGSHLGP
jgi:hypothetical protein